MSTTFFALFPPLIAIIISLITKKVNLSLFLGILVGVLLYCGFNPFRFFEVFFEILSDKAKDNMDVLIFIVLLGMIVHLIHLSGATDQYVKWAQKRIKSRKTTLLLTSLLGVFLFIDDYFNCMAIGTIMRPVSDKQHISREKLSYIIDSTAAPICMIAPISSWAAAVSSSLPDNSSIDGFQLFMKTIPYNFYSILSIAMVFLTALLSVDYGKMRIAENQAQLTSVTDKPENLEESSISSKGKIIDIIFPIASLIVFSIAAMLYSGDYFDGGITISEAFANCDAIYALAAGSAITVLLLPVLYIPRHIVTGTQYLDGLVNGFKNMVPSVLILLFAWTLSGICGADYLNAGGYVASVVKTYHISLAFLPFIFFLISVLLSFSTGTSWGTFAILLPIVISIFNDSADIYCVITAAAILGGAVAGDHLSPISDTTILSSTAANCDHIAHVQTQLEYGLLVVSVSSVIYLMMGLIQNAVLGIVGGLLLIFLFLLLVKTSQRKVKKSI